MLRSVPINLAVMAALHVVCLMNALKQAFGSKESGGKALGSKALGSKALGSKAFGGKCVMSHACGETSILCHIIISHHHKTCHIIICSHHHMNALKQASYECIKRAR